MIWNKYLGERDLEAKIRLGLVIRRCNQVSPNKKFMSPLRSVNILYVTPFYVTPVKISKSLCHHFYVTPGWHKKKGGWHKKKTYGCRCRLPAAVLNFLNRCPFFFFPWQPKVPVTHLQWNFVTGTFGFSRAYYRKMSRASSKISRSFFPKKSRASWKFHGQFEKKLSRAI